MWLFITRIVVSVALLYVYAFIQWKVMNLHNGKLPLWYVFTAYVTMTSLLTAIWNEKTTKA